MQPAFTAGAVPPTFVASARFNDAMVGRARYLSNVLARDWAVMMPPESIVYPGVAVPGTMRLDLGGRWITRQAWSVAHTDNDLTLFDEPTRTLFASDLLFIGQLPVVDGSLRGWLAVMTEMRRLDVALVVPRHGASSTAWLEALDAQQRYLLALRDGARAEIKAGMTIAQAVNQVGREAAASLRWRSTRAAQPLATARSFSCGGRGRDRRLQRARRDR